MENSFDNLFTNVEIWNEKNFKFVLECFYERQSIFYRKYGCF